MGGYSTGSRAAADLAQPAPWSPSDRRSGPSGRSGPSVRSPAVLLRGAPDHQCRYPARVVPAGWRHSSYRCCIASLAPAALPWQGHQPEGRGSVGAALARPEPARLLPLRLSQKSAIYKDKLRTSEQLKRALIAEVSVMPSEMVDRAVDHLQTVRLPQVIRRGGAHIEHLL